MSESCLVCMTRNQKTIPATVTMIIGTLESDCYMLDRYYCDVHAREITGCFYNNRLTMTEISKDGSVISHTVHEAMIRWGTSHAYFL